MNPSVLYRLEQSELRGSISVLSLARVANAMDCQMIYAIVPRDGKTLEDLVEKRLWRKVLGSGD
jgi:hypothetical protein